MTWLAGGTATSADERIASSNETRDKGIKGRSHMNKSQLEVALRR